MPRLVPILLMSIVTWFRSRLAMKMECIALRHQVAVYKQSVSHLKIRPADRLLWVWLSRLWPSWQQALEFVQPRTVIAWQQQRFRDSWRRLSQRSKPGRPAIAKEVLATRSRLDLRYHVSRPSQSYGHRRSQDCASADRKYLIPPDSVVGRMKAEK